MNQVNQEIVSFTTQDHCQIEGTVFVPENPNGYGVVCLHQLRLDRNSYTHLALALQSKGFYVYAIDLRGHGKSTVCNSQEISHETMQESDFSKIPGMDVEEAKKVLMEKYQINPERIGLIGSSIGANSALISAGRDPRVAFVIALSPGLDFRSIQPEADVSQIQKPVVYVASSEDAYSANSAQFLFEKTVSQTKKIVFLENAGHGTKMLDADATLEPLLLEWMMEIIS